MAPSIMLAIFEGGAEEPVDEVDRFFAALRRAATLDLVQLACSVADLHALLCSDDASLLEEARRLGAATRRTRAPFHLGRELQEIVRTLAPDALLVMGGAAAPLLRSADLEWYCAALAAEPAVVLLNNPLSPDIVGIRPARTLLDLPLPSTDNQLGVALRRAGLPRRLIPNEPRINVDLDTPADALVLSLAEVPGPRLRSALAEVPWRDARARLEHAVEVVVQGNGAEVFLAGRVSPVLVSFLNTHLPVRTRVLAEERGMKALGREERGQVRSLLAEWVEAAGVDGFIAALERTCAAAFIDTRPLFAHGGRRVSARDRFRSDLGLWTDIQDSFLRTMTRCAVTARIPVVLGGHSLVYGGLWYLLDTRLRERALGTSLARQELVAGRQNPPP